MVSLLSLLTVHGAVSRSRRLFQSAIDWWLLFIVLGAQLRTMLEARYSARGNHTYRCTVVIRVTAFKAVHLLAPSFLEMSCLAHSYGKVIC